MINWRRLLNRVAKVIVEETKEPKSILSKNEIRELERKMFHERSNSDSKENSEYVEKEG